MTWGTSLSFNMAAGSHALVFANNVSYMLWLSGGGLAVHTLNGTTESVSITASGTTVTVETTVSHTITAYYIEP